MKIIITLLLTSLSILAQPGGIQPITIGNLGNSSSGANLPADAPGVLTNNGSGSLAWQVFPASSGGSSFNTNGFTGQSATVLADGSIGMTNIFAALGYFTNTTVDIIINGDSIAAGTGTTDGPHDLGYNLTNFFLPSNFKIRTNASTAGKTVATCDSECNTLLSTWIRPGTNTLFIQQGGVNDAANNDSSDTMFSHFVSIIGKVHASNCIVVVPTCLQSSLLLGSQRENVRLLNRYIKNATNIDYIADWAAVFPSPPDTTFYNGGTHPASDKPLAYEINQSLLRGRFNNYPFNASTPQEPGYVFGSTTPFTGAQAIGSDGVFFGQGSVPAMYLFDFTVQNYYTMPVNATKTVHIGYNTSSHTVADFSNDRILVTASNTMFVKSISLATNVITPPTTGYGHFWASNYNLYWVTPTKTNLVVLGQ